MTSLFQRLQRRFSRHDAAANHHWPTIYLPEDIAKATGTIIASYGKLDEPHEGIAYWAGVAGNDSWVITTVLAPQATTTPGSYVTSAVANALVVSEVSDLRLNILAQVHGHPGGWVGHSGGDDAGAFMPYEGFYSVVVPYYGRQGLIPLTICGVHHYQNGKFVELAASDIQGRFILVPSSIDLRKRR